MHTILPLKRSFTRYCQVMGIITCLMLCSSSAMAAKPTNFLFFLVDDLGWADLGCFGSTFYETPHIDQLCASGMKLTQAYAASPVCSPTRASIMTGRHPVRVAITDWIPGARTKRFKKAKFEHVNDRDNLALAEVTLAEVLGEQGYQTFFAGKWHLGDRGHWPTDQGFDINIGGCKVGSPPGGYYAPWTNPNLKAEEPDEYLTERLTDESIKFLNQRDETKPFLLYLSYYNVHTPLTPYRKRIAHFREKAASLTGESPTLSERSGISRTRQDNAAYASMIAAVDDSVGAILQQLDELNLADNTVVIFFSDNGGLCTLGRPGAPTSNLPLRSGKGWLYEGGIREPTIIRAPGVTQAGSVSDEPIISMDFFPTMLALAGLPAREDLHQDGRNLVPTLRGEEKSGESRTLYWHYPHYHGSTWTPGAAIRDGDWKLIEFYHWDDAELYNLKNDPGEQMELSEQHPAIKEALREKLRSWQEHQRAKMPEPIAESSGASDQ